jgi:hypothetical protein
MASLRMVVTFVLVLTLCSTAPAAAQAIGPICLEMTVGGASEFFVIFASPMGSAGGALGAQFLLSAVPVGGFPYSGAAVVSSSGERADFTLLAGFPGGPLFALSPGGIIRGGVNLQTGAGTGLCATIGSGLMPLCGTNTQVTLALLPC